jgi:hypothetical protein
MNQNQHQYETSSLALAAAIQLASTSKLQAVEKSRDSSKASFVFNRTSDLDKVIELFWQKALPLDAFSYFETIRYIKSRLYEEGK